jgi:hypothetical protein
MNTLHTLRTTFALTAMMSAFVAVSAVAQDETQDANNTSKQAVQPRTEEKIAVQSVSYERCSEARTNTKPTKTGVLLTEVRHDFNHLASKQVKVQEQPKER